MKNLYGILYTVDSQINARYQYMCKIARNTFLRIKNQAFIFWTDVN